MSSAAVAKVGVDINSAKGNVKDVCPSVWIQIPDCNAICVQEIAHFAVDQYNVEYKESLKFKGIEIGWYMELQGRDLKFHLNITVTDCLGCVFKYQVIVIEKVGCGGKVRKLESFKLGVDTNSAKGNVKDVFPSVWIQIPDCNAVCVQEIAHFAVDQYNVEYKESFKFKGIEIGWYMELQGRDLKVRLNITVTDCLGRVFKYAVIVIEKVGCGGKVRELKSLKLIAKN